MKTKQEYINEISEASKAIINTLLRQALSDPEISGTDYVEIRNAYDTRCKYLAENRQKLINDEGINRRNIPIEFMDYIAQKHGYDNFAHLNGLGTSKTRKVFEDIKHRFSQTEVNTRIAYGRSMIKVKRLPGETALDFIKRVEHLRYHPEVTETKISGTVPGGIIISGDAETLSLSDLKPETVKQVAAELLEQEKRKTGYLALLSQGYGGSRRVIDPYATPVFDLKSFGKAIQSLEEITAKSREVNGKIIDFFKAVLADKVIIAQIHDEIVTESVTDFAERWGRMLLDAIPKKHAFISEEDSFKIWQKTGDSEKLFESDGMRRFWPIPETGEEIMFDGKGNYRRIPREEVLRSQPHLKIETNQQWSAEELSEFTKKQFEEARQIHSRVNRKGQLPVTEVKIRNFTPDNWPVTAPPYFTSEGWEFEKAMKRRQLKSMLTIEWLEKQQTEKHALVAKRLREILAV